MENPESDEAKENKFGFVFSTYEATYADLEIIDRLKDESLEKVDLFEDILRSPVLFIANRFFDIRNEIDFEAETLLVEFDSYQSTLNQYGELFTNDNTKNQTLDLITVVNDVRMEMINRLHAYESECLKKQNDNKSERKDMFESNLSKITQLKNEILQKYNDLVKLIQSTQVKISTVNKMFDSIDNHINLCISKLKCDLLNGRSMFFSKADSLNKLGILVIFEDNYVTDHEIKSIKKRVKDFKKIDFFNYYSELFDESFRKTESERFKHYLFLMNFRNHLLQMLNDDQEESNAEKTYDSEKILESFLLKFDKRLMNIKKLNLALVSNELNVENFQNLVCLNELILNQNDIECLNDNVFDELKSLEILSLDSNRLVSINDKVFKPLINLKQLHLNGNRLKDLHENCFSCLENLEILNLGSNYLNKMKNKLFDPLKRLKVLALTNNQIDFIESNSFNSIHQLEILILSHNNIKAISEYEFAYLSSLKSLLLDNNKIESLHDRAFNGLARLEVLSLEANKIRRMPKNLLVNLTNLKELSIFENDLRFNNTDDLEFNDVFLNQIRLETLNLIWNDFELINNKVFINLTSLIELYLYGNKIADIVDGSFEGLLKLEVLDIGYNKLKRINDKAFKGLNALKYLSLSKNSIDFIHLDAFKDLNNLQRLSLHSNSIVINKYPIKLDFIRYLVNLEEINIFDDNQNSIELVRNQILK